MSDLLRQKLITQSTAGTAFKMHFAFKGSELGFVRYQQDEIIPILVNKVPAFQITTEAAIKLQRPHWPWRSVNVCFISSLQNAALNVSKGQRWLRVCSFVHTYRDISRDYCRAGGSLEEDDATDHTGDVCELPDPNMCDLRNKPFSPAQHREHKL